MQLPEPDNIFCPQCHSTKLYRDGIRYLADGSGVQRWLCRTCAYRFSEKLLQKKLKWSINSPIALELNSQLCAIKQEAKKLTTAIETKTIAGESLEAKGKIIEFAWWMKKQGYKDGTTLSRTKLLKIMVKRGANLYDPETIKDVIAKQAWSEGRKENAVNAYSTFLNMNGGTWNPPIYCRIQKLPFIPKEEEIDALIASCAPKASTLLQTLKETAARVGEAWALKWADLDTENRTLRLTPEKGSNPRIFKISPKLLSMLLAMPRKDDFIFGSYPLRGYRTCFTRQRRKAASKLGNPRLLQITFHTFRHWKATTEYHKTKDILYVMKLLGHKSIKNTLIYTQLIEFEEDDGFVCKVAKTVQEASQLIESGFEYVCAIDDAKLFKKRK
ncbi:MAG: tyrosine-type recombinase/integrase [Candidatus Bathyarchaeia archaeon]|jgi:integrase